MLKCLHTSCHNSASMSVVVGFSQPFRNTILFWVQESLFLPCAHQSWLSPAHHVYLFLPLPIPVLFQSQNLSYVSVPPGPCLGFPPGLLFTLSICCPTAHLLPPGWGCPASLSDPQDVCSSSSETALLDPSAFQSCLTKVSPATLHP